MPAARARNGDLQHVAKDYRDLVAQALEQGAELRSAVGRHPLRLALPGGGFAPLSVHGGDPHARANFIAQLRRAGLQVGPRRKRTPPEKNRVWAWLILQHPDRQFTAAEFADEMGLTLATAKRYLRQREREGRVVVVSRKANPRGLGTPTYAGRMPLVPIETAEPAPANGLASHLDLAGEPRSISPGAAPVLFIEPDPPRAVDPVAEALTKVSEGLLLLAEAAEMLKIAWGSAWRKT